MTVPAGAGPAGPEELLGYEAVRLFASRAAAVYPGFTVDAGNAAAVAGICHRLDGIPLALELAAVRLRSLSPAQILARLDRRLPLLSPGGAAELPQRRTLEAALEWSYGLLTEAEQAMWRRVSVFAGSFDLDAAEAVGAGGTITVGEIANLIDALVAKSVLSRAGGDGKARYRLLDTIAEFGLGKLRAEGDDRELHVRHRDWYAALAARPDAFGPYRAEWITTLDTDHENIRAALAFCLSEPQEVPAGTALACDLWRYWDSHGHLTEGRRVLAVALQKLPDATGVRPRALWVAGFLAELQGDVAAARPLLKAALSAARQAGDLRSVAYASSFLGYILSSEGDLDRGHALAETALRLHQQSGDQIGAAMSLTQLGFTRLRAGDLTAAAARFGECAQLAHSSGNLWAEKYARWGLGITAWLLGENDDAVAHVRAALRAGRDMDDRLGIAACLDTLAWIAASQRKPARALTLLGAADTAWASIPALLPPTLRKHHAAALDTARESLPEQQARAATAKGTVLSQADAIAYALGQSPQPGSDAWQATASTGPLTRREEEVARLVARGQTNSQIASRLVISARTVDAHVQHIMTKLGVNSRAEIAAWSAARRPAPAASESSTSGGNADHETARTGSPPASLPAAENR
jgi:DNA-binding CsgD family transcriptional regulator/tetratricopeptide (TPR) repeat protein